MASVVVSFMAYFLVVALFVGTFLSVFTMFFFVPKWFHEEDLEWYAYEQQYEESHRSASL